MAQMTKGQSSTTLQITEIKNYPHQKVRFEVLPDGKHEHNLVSIRTEVTITDTLRNLIKAKWKKWQGQHGGEVGGINRSSSRKAG